MGRQSARTVYTRNNDEKTYESVAHPEQPITITAAGKRGAVVTTTMEPTHQHKAAAATTTDVQMCKATLKNSLGLVKHYFLRIPDLELEIHPGRYPMGTHHTLGFYRHTYDVIETHRVCQFCLQRTIDESTDSHSVWLYPLVNCEALTRGLVGQLPISYQILVLPIIVLLVVLSLWFFHYLLVAIILLIVYIVAHKIESHISPKLSYCSHLIPRRYYRRHRTAPPQHDDTTPWTVDLEQDYSDSDSVDEFVGYKVPDYDSEDYNVPSSF